MLTYNVLKTLFFHFNFFCFCTSLVVFGGTAFLAGRLKCEKVKDDHMDARMGVRHQVIQRTQLAFGQVSFLFK